MDLNEVSTASGKEMLLIVSSNVSVRLVFSRSIKGRSFPLSEEAGFNIRSIADGSEGNT